MFSFQSNNSRSQKKFDVIFGVIAPVLCLIFDPGVFRLSDPCYELFASSATFAYTAIGLGICLLVVWLAVGERFKIASAFFAGVFMVGFVFALLLGIILLPASVVLLFSFGFGLLWYEFAFSVGIISLPDSIVLLFYFGFGLLGLLPFLTALVYFRNSVKALRQSRGSSMRLPARVILVIVAAGIVLGLPSLAQHYYPPVIPASAFQPCPFNGE